MFPQVLELDDADRDGQLSYPEFMAGRRRSDRPSVLVSVYLPTCLSVCLSVCMLAHMIIIPSVYPSVFLYTCSDSHVYRFVCLPFECIPSLRISVRLLVCLFISYLSFCLSV